MTKFFTLASIATLSTAMLAAKPAEAFNDWYKQGFTDGTIYVQQSSQQQIDQLQAENWRLRQQIAQMEEQQAYIEEQAAVTAGVNEDILASLPKGGDDLRALRRSLIDD